MGDTVMHASKILMGTLLIGMTLTLTACPKSGGGGSTPAATPAATPGSVIPANTTPGIIGHNRWQGPITAINVSSVQYPQFMSFVNIPVNSPLELMLQSDAPNGSLPGRIYFKISTASYGNNYGSNYWYAGGISDWGSGYINGNGFIVNYYGYSNYTSTCVPSPSYQCTQPAPVNSAVPTIQISAQFANLADPSHQVLNVSITYQGVQVATGTINLNNYGNGYGHGHWPRRWRRPYRWY
jgi:hypothetical protein